MRNWRRVSVQSFSTLAVLGWMHGSSGGNGRKVSSPLSLSLGQTLNDSGQAAAGCLKADQISEFLTIL
jgi:hypothetical protein